MKRMMILAALLILTACAAAAESPTLTASPSPTVTDMPSITPSPVPTITPIPPSDTPIPPSDTPEPPVGTLIQISVPGTDLFEGASSWQASGVERLGGPKYSPDGSQLAMVSPEGVLIYDAESLELLTVLDTEGGAFIVAWSADGTLLAVCHGDYVWEPDQEVSLSIWDLASGTRVSTFSLGYCPIYDNLALSPHGKWLAALTADEDRNPVILDSETGDVILELEIDHNRYCPIFAFSSDGQRLAGGCDGWKDIIWDTATGTQLQLDKDVPYEALASWATALAWSPQGDKVAFAVVKYGTAITIYDKNTGQLLADISIPDSSELLGLAWFPDGEHILSSSYETIRIWDIETLEEIKVIDDLGDLRDIALSPDGKQLIVIRDDDYLIQIDMAALLDG